MQFHTRERIEKQRREDLNAIPQVPLSAQNMTDKGRYYLDQLLSDSSITDNPDDWANSLATIEYVDTEISNIGSGNGLYTGPIELGGAGISPSISDMESGLYTAKTGTFGTENFVGIFDSDRAMLGSYRPITGAYSLVWSDNDELYMQASNGTDLARLRIFSGAMTISGNDAGGFAGVTYTTIDESNFVTNSLVNKGYVDGRTYDAIVIVKQASDFGVIDPTKLYVIDGIVDMGATSLEVPVGGINIHGHDFNVSQLTSSEDNYTMFTSPVGGSGDVLIDHVSFTVSGTNSQLFDITGATGGEAFEFDTVNFNGCTSLGTVDTYRQGLETGTGRFGGTPALTLAGTWLGGYFIETSIVRGLTDGAYALYQAGAGFSMNSRFRTNQNVDLNSTVAFFDFSPSNFVNPSTLQLEDCLVTRNGVINGGDSTMHPNIGQMDLASAWHDNIGIANTFVGGTAEVTTEVQTTIPGANTFVDLAGTFTTSALEHFDSPAEGQLRHLGDSPREFSIYVNMSIDGGSNDEIDLKVVVWDDSASTFVDYKTQRRVVNNFQGGRDVAFFTFLDNIYLDRNDYVKIQVANATDATNVTAELGSEFTVATR